jgi:archaellum biogenesis ATPase FlaH
MFNFLRSHNGIRKKRLHLLIAPTGAGKSTVVRSILCDMVFRNKDKKILLWLSEETKQEFIMEFSATVPPNEVLKNIRIVSEMDSNSSEEEIKKLIVEAIEYYEIDCIVIDNITTSRLYMDKSTKEQSAMARWYKSLCKETTLFLIAHTNGDEFNNRFLNENDIRGSKTITNLAQFLYILQPVNVGDKLYQFINVLKHRGQKLTGRFYRLFYSEELKSFERDQKVSFNDIKEVFKQRNQLGK